MTEICNWLDSPASDIYWIAAISLVVVIWVVRRAWEIRGRHVRENNHKRRKAMNRAIELLRKVLDETTGGLKIRQLTRNEIADYMGGSDISQLQLNADSEAVNE